MSEILFIVKTPLDVEIIINKEYWRYVVEVKHPVMEGKENIVKKILKNPEEIRRSKIDNDVFLYYKEVDKLYCVVVKHKNKECLLITCYPTDKIKEGEIIWRK